MDSKFKLEIIPVPVVGKEIYLSDWTYSQNQSEECEVGSDLLTNMMKSCVDLGGLEDPTGIDDAFNTPWLGSFENAGAVDNTLSPESMIRMSFFIGYHENYEDAIIDKLDSLKVTYTKVSRNDIDNDGTTIDVPFLTILIPNDENFATVKFYFRNTHCRL